MGLWTVCLQAVVCAGLAQPPGTPPGTAPGSPGTGTTTAAAPSGGGREEVPLGLNVFALALLGAITTVLVYPTRRSES